MKTAGTNMQLYRAESCAGLLLLIFSVHMHSFGGVVGREVGRGRGWGGGGGEVGRGRGEEEER